MIRRFFFILVLVALAIIFYFSPTFKEVGAGIAILLFGMIMLEEGFSTFTEGPLQKVLKRFTNKLYKSLGIGFVTTALLQSSSLISVISISFISAGLIDLYAGIGIVFGANIGTTATSWLVSIFGLKIKVSTLAMPMLFFGIIFYLQKNRSLKGLGSILAGLGFFFLGIHYMKEGFEVFEANMNLADFALSGLLGLVLYTLVGILFTVTLQSSSATMALILTALAAEQITYENALSLAIGANVGTTITAILGGLGSSIAGKRLAGAHFIFNVLTGLLALIFIIPLSRLVNLMASYIGVGTDNFEIKLSIFHTLFNLAGVIIMLPFIRLLIRFLNRLFKDKVEEQEIEYPKFLNKSVLAYPQSAFRALLNESKALFENVTFMIVAHGLHLHRTDIKGEEKLKHIIEKSREEIALDIDDLYYKKVKVIYSKIVKYATLAQSEFSLSPEAMEAFTRIKLANRNMVEVIKNLRGLHHNVGTYMDSENPYIKKEYNRLRKKISVVLREIYTTRKDAQSERHLEKLEKLKAKAEKSDVMINGSLDALIREHKITSKMATSLANDSEVVARISEHLIETTELLYIDSDTLLVITENVGRKKANE